MIVAHIMTKQGSLDNAITYEHYCDTVADLNNIPLSQTTLGSVAIVVNDEDDGMGIYIANSQKEWTPISTSIGGGSGEISLDLIHVCSNNEYDSVTKVPTIEDAESNKIYLVPNSESGNNVFDEWIYADEAWEKFGGGSISVPVTDVQVNGVSVLDAQGVANVPKATASVFGVISIPGASGGGLKFSENKLVVSTATDAQVKAGENNSRPVTPFNQHTSTFYGLAKAAGDATQSASDNPVGTYTDNAKTAIQTMLGVPSVNDIPVESGTDVGAIQGKAWQIGSSTSTPVASGKGSFAVGFNTTASGVVAFAEGVSTTASAQSAHAEGGGTIASGASSHAEGGYTTASGLNSHSEGENTIASGFNSHAEGEHTIANGTCSHVSGMWNVEDIIYPPWTANTSYEIGDKITRDGIGYECTTANSDSSFIRSNWIEIYKNTQHAIIIGNGTLSDVSNYTYTRSNAYALDWDGNGHYMGDVYVGANADSSGGVKLATVEDIPVQSGTGEGSIEGKPIKLGDIIYSNTASGQGSVALGFHTKATNRQAYAEGSHTSALGLASHAEGGGSLAIGDQSHAEGNNQTSYGIASHAEGVGGSNTILLTSTDNTKRYFVKNMPEYINTGIVLYNRDTDEIVRIIEVDTDNEIITLDKTLGILEDVRYPVFIGAALEMASHIEGIETIANGTAQHVQGTCNAVDTNNTYADIVGNGPIGFSGVRSNAYALTWTGDGKYAGDVYVHANANSSGGTKLATVEDIPDGGRTTHNYALDGIDLSTIYADADALCADLALEKYDNIHIGDYWPVTLNGTYRDYGSMTAPGGTTYYSDTALTTEAGTLSENTEVTPVSNANLISSHETYCNFNIGSTTYYVAYENCLDYCERTLQNDVMLFEVAGINQYWGYGNSGANGFQNGKSHLLLSARDGLPHMLKMRKCNETWEGQHTDTFTGDGTTAEFTLSGTAGTIGYVFVAGSRKTYDTDYTFKSNKITFKAETIPTSGQEIKIEWMNAKTPWTGSALYRTFNDPDYGILPLIQAADVKLYSHIYMGPNSKGMRYYGETRNKTNQQSGTWENRGVLFLPTEDEVWGRPIYSASGTVGSVQQLQWPIYANGGRRHFTKGAGNAASRGSVWTASSYSTGSFALVGGYGFPSGSSVVYAQVTAPAFLLV